MKYTRNIDGRLMPEAAPQRTAREKSAATLSGQAADDIDREHHDARTRDAAVEGIRGLTRATRDRDRAYPRPAGAPANPRKQIPIPDPGETRTSPSNYQLRLRAQTKRAAQTRLRHTEFAALNRLVSDEAHWMETNERLSDAYTAGADLTEADRLHVQRIDRAIRRYEESNDRRHLVYAPMAIADEDDLGDAADTVQWVRDQVQAGDRYTFDQFTAADHDPKKAAATDAPVLLEISGRRGLYLGGSDNEGGTSHLLPRGLHLEVVSVSESPIDGAKGKVRPIITLKVLDDP